MNRCPCCFEENDSTGGCSKCAGGTYCSHCGAKVLCACGAKNNHRIDCYSNTLKQVKFVGVWPWLVDRP